MVKALASDSRGREFNSRPSRCQAKAKFHYAIQVCDQVADLVCDLDSVMEFGFNDLRQDVHTHTCVCH